MKARLNKLQELDELYDQMMMEDNDQVIDKSAIDDPQLAEVLRKTKVSTAQGVMLTETSICKLLDAHFQAALEKVDRKRKRDEEKAHRDAIEAPIVTLLASLGFLTKEKPKLTVQSMKSFFAANQNFLKGVAQPKTREDWIAFMLARIDTQEQLPRVRRLPWVSSSGVSQPPPNLRVVIRRPQVPAPLAPPTDLVALPLPPTSDESPQNVSSQLNFLGGTLFSHPGFD